MNIPEKHLRQLWKLFASIENEKEAKMLMEDLLTPQEIEATAERWQIIQQLRNGIPQRKIAENLKISIAKITRGSHALQNGSGGFNHFIKKIQKPRVR